MRYALTAAVLALVISGCISTSVTPLSGKTYPPVSEADVVIYLDEADIPGPYEKVAVIYARGDYAMTDESLMFKTVRKKAAKLGANGVLLREITEPSTGAKVAQVLLDTDASRKSELIAIYVLPATQTSAVLTD